MAVTVRQKSEKIETITGNTTVTEPAGAASGDVLFAFGIRGNTGTITRPTSWVNIYNDSQGAVTWDVSYIQRGGSAPSLTWTVSGTSVYREVYVVCLQASAAITLDSQSAAGSKGNGSLTANKPNPPATTAVATSSLALTGGEHFDGSTTNPWTCTGYTVQTANALGDDGVLFSKALSAAGLEDPAQFGTGSNAGTGDFWNGFTVTFTDIAAGQSVVPLLMRQYRTRKN